MALRTDHKDDILDLTQNTQRKYRMITNTDGTISFEDVTVYLQIGDSFGAAELNEIANSVNEGGSNMYYDPATDSKYLKNEDGEWVFIGSAGLKELPLYVNGNQGNFVGYAGGIDYPGGGAPTLTIGETLYASMSNNVTLATGSVISDKYDLTRFSKLKFHHESKTASNTTNKISVFVTDVKQTQMIPVTSKILASGSNQNVSGDVELDVTNLSGEYYIGFYLQANVSSVNTTISNMKLS